MEFSRKKIISKYPWLVERDQPFIISADYDGLICASLLHQQLNWQLAGYYDLTSLWISDTARKYRRDLIWVDLNILPVQGRAIGGHIVSPDRETPPGFETSCNPNILSGLTAKDFRKKFPFSTLIYLLWLHNLRVENSLLARLLVLQADAVWLKFQNYPENVKTWMKMLGDYDWEWLFKRVNTRTFEKRIDGLLYPKLTALGAVSRRGKLKSVNYGFRSLQYQFNPDWDEDVVLALFRLFGNELKWTPPPLPEITRRIEGRRSKVPLHEVKKTGLQDWLKKRKVFSYAIPSPQILNYTTFGEFRRSPLEKKGISHGG
ncbi:MAG: hypothetical protein GXO91_09930 [FCB group bacterium]|nr:hypothetical protein [FCB group bacterium]